jgi:hypothetical protein
LRLVLKCFFLFCHGAKLPHSQSYRKAGRSIFINNQATAADRSGQSFLESGSWKEAESDEF